MPSPSLGRAGGLYGLGAHPVLRDGDGGPGAAGAERVPGGRNRILKVQLKGRPMLLDAEAQIMPAQRPARVRDRWIPVPFPPPLAFGIFAYLARIVPNPRLDPQFGQDLCAHG